MATTQKAADRRKAFFMLLKQNWIADSSNSEMMDKSILGLSAMFLIVTFWQMTQADASWILIPVAAFFIVSKAAVFLSLYTSFQAIKYHRDHLADYYHNENDDEFKLSDRWNKLTRRLQWLAVEAFFFGLIALTIEVCIRIWLNN